MLHFQVAQHGHVEAVGLGSEHAHPMRVRMRRDRPHSPRLLGHLLKQLRIDRVEVADARYQPDVVAAMLELGAGGGKHVAVARGVDHIFGQDRLAARLALKHGAADRVAVHDRVDAPAVKQYLHAPLPGASPPSRTSASRHRPWGQASGRWLTMPPSTFSRRRIISSTTPMHTCFGPLLRCPSTTSTSPPVHRPPKWL